MNPVLAEFSPYLVLIFVGFLPNEIWRLLGLVLARRLHEGAEGLTWVRAVATAILAGVVGKLIFFPPGALATVPLSVRIGATLVGLLAFVLIRRSVFAGVVAGEAALIGGALLLSP
jgi:Branched-chain amino acid transport protein (AzlD)